MARNKAAWETLLTSDDLQRDLNAIYTRDVLEKLSHLLEKTDDPKRLIPGVHRTARSFLRGKYEKQVEQSDILQHSGHHLAKIGIASKQLAYSLTQATKSARVQEILLEELRATLANGRPIGEAAQREAHCRTGPALPLAYLQDITAALAEAVDGLIEMPERTDSARAVRAAGDDFVVEYSAKPDPAYTALPVNHALEMTAMTFKELWEANSDVRYIRGGFKHDRGSYDSAPAYGLFLIVSPLDPNIRESLCGTAIENIRKRESDSRRSDSEGVFP